MPPEPPTAAQFAAVSRAPATRAAYARDWTDFAAWCAEAGLAPLAAGPAGVAAYLAARAARLKPATLERRLAAIAVHQRQAGVALDLKDPLLADVRAGIRRALGTAPAQKEPLTPDELARLAAVLPRDLAGLRDRAILLLGFAAALRRSELAQLERRDLAFTAEGVALVLRRAKEDQEARAQIKGVPFGRVQATCPVGALKAWLIAARQGEGPVFRTIDRHGNPGEALSGKAVAAVVKRAVARLGAAEGWTRVEIAHKVAAVAGHSLRAGFVTAAAACGATEWEIMRHTGHRRAETVRRYIRLGSPFERNLAARVGL